MKHPIRSKIVIPTAIALGVTLVVLLAGCGQRSPQAIEPEAGSTVDIGSRQLDEWKRPVTKDPHAYALAFAKVIWTYDTARHDYSDWRDGVSTFAGNAPGGIAVARSLLPTWAEFDQLAIQKARGSVFEVTASTTPELDSLRLRQGLPEGWRAFILRGKQSVVTGDKSTVIERRASVSVACTSICSFWSGSGEISL
ncbi:hypothetical protein HPO96_20805 [Kribbella sandramycini]|uniref:Uncharacterized protein n=1 Tax=Kribbella sandramycini TaxID=60450 RepID=A0A7Y4L1M7_9ACTN|nr:hypothetical protein [Kribbella sandramycini]MBB6566658.1 hypothetical protein [Kribbella sandramycini]NOL42690.1 hypothetical protein [Kribbella sandramycini]